MGWLSTFGFGIAFCSFRGRRPERMGNYWNSWLLEKESPVRPGSPLSGLSQLFCRKLAAAASCGQGGELRKMDTNWR